MYDNERKNKNHGKNSGSKMISEKYEKRLQQTDETVIIDEVFTNIKKVK